MSKSLDRYLYAVRTLKEKYLCVRAIDVAHYLGFSKASVSIAIRQMKERGLIEAEPDGNLQFTELGKNRSDLLGSRVCFFQQLLTDAGVDPSQALQDAISFSWEMSEASFEAFRAMRTG
ncbi:MAG: metal-dependent transcriptional regulator [Clostridia bacterium]|nr:metal-dependent transcriptional regulator [Clostridia bacterium]